MWDTRCRDLPAKKTALSDAKHKWPIQGLKAIGSATSPSIVSVSSDGRLCQWNTGNLISPIHTIDAPLKEKEPFSCVTCLGLPQEDTHSFALGTASGQIIFSELKMHSTKAEKSSTNHNILKEHLGPVTNIH